MTWNCTKYNCESCNIRTKGVCNTVYHKAYKLDKQIKDLKHEMKGTFKTLRKWQDLIDVLKDISEVTKE